MYFFIYKYIKTKSKSLIYQKKIIFIRFSFIYLRRILR